MGQSKHGKELVGDSDDEKAQPTPEPQGGVTLESLKNRTIEKTDAEVHRQSQPGKSSQSEPEEGRQDMNPREIDLLNLGQRKCRVDQEQDNPHSHQQTKERDSISQAPVPETPCQSQNPDAVKPELHAPQHVTPENDLQDDGNELEQGAHGHHGGPTQDSQVSQGQKARVQNSTLQRSCRDRKQGHKDQKRPGCRPEIAKGQAQATSLCNCGRRSRFRHDTVHGSCFQILKMTFPVSSSFIS